MSLNSRLSSSRNSSGTPTAHFESFAADQGWSASFGEPTWQHAAYTLDEVVPLLRTAEAAARQGMWVALAISYEAAPAFDPALEVRPSPDFPLAWMAGFEAPLSTDPKSISARPFLISEWEPSLGGRRYQRAIHSIRDYIERGDTYQVNYTFPLRGHVGGDLFGCFRVIGRSQGGAYSAYVDVGTHKILSFSPELFIECRGDKLVTRPMKGTLARGRWLEEDCQRAQQLSASAKDRAENVMIVDLLRSDLGKIAEIGSVKVSDLFAVERLSRVLQMTSTVTAVRKPGVNLVDVIQALFPCGSITGAPKRRTMAIIKELERQPRGIYTGTLGLLLPGGDAVLSVAIRTVVVDGKSGAARMSVGAGITWDSTIEGEYNESCLKARFLTDPWPDFDLLETIELSEGVYSLLDRHLTRVRSSASYFGFCWNETHVSNALRRACKSHPLGRWRVRLLVARAGTAEVEVHPLDRIKNPPVLVKFATCPVDDTDPLLFHKTTARSRYNAELEQCRPCDDVIFWNCRGEVTESTIANVVVFTNGKHWTPPREAGLLAGTLREELISKEELFERTITKRELEELGSFALINSVRGWIPAAISKSTTSQHLRQQEESYVPSTPE